MKFEKPMWLQIAIKAFQNRDKDMVFLFDIEYDSDGYPTEVQALFPVLSTAAFEGIGQAMIDLAREVEDQHSIISEVNRIINTDVHPDEEEDDDDY